MERLRRANDVSERRLLGIEIEHAPIWKLQRADAARPDMERNRAEVGDVEERFLVVADEVSDLPLRILAPDPDGADPFGRELGRVLLIERFPVDAVGEPRHHEWAVTKIRQHPRRHGAIVLDQVSFRVPLGGPVDLLQIRVVDRLFRRRSRFRGRRVDRLCDWGGALTDAVSRRFVVSHAKEHRVPQQSVGGPLAIAHLADVHRLDPRRRLRLRYLVRHHAADQRTAARWSGADDRAEQRTELVEHILIEAGADPASIDEGLVDVVGDVQRAEVIAGAPRLREADDDEVAGALALDLQPLSGAAGSVRGIGFLGDDPLEADLPHLLEEGLAIALDVFEQPDSTELGYRFGEELLSPDEWKGAEIELLIRKEVEGVERRWQLHRRAADVHRRRQPAALLEPREARLPFAVEDDDLAVDDDILDRERLDGARDLREYLRVVVPVAREEDRLTVRLTGNEAVAVELELEDPAVACEGFICGLGEHRLKLHDVDTRFDRARLLDGIAQSRTGRDPFLHFLDGES